VHLAGRRARFRIAGEDLARRTLMPLTHLLDYDPSAAPRTAPELQVELFSGSETGVGLPFEPLQRGLYADGERWLTQAEEGAVSCLDRETGVIVGWRAGNEVVIEEAWRTLAWIAPVWFLDHSVQVVHAGLVAHRGAGALIVGESGAGKSTTSLACAAAGMQFLGDDHAGIEETSEGWVGHSVSCVGRIASATLAAHPSLAVGIEGGEVEEKTLIVVEPDRTQATAPIRLMVLLRLAVAAPAGQPKPTDALKGFLPTSLTGIPGPSQERMARLSRLVKTVPARWLELDGSPEQAAAKVKRELEEFG
jgi:hypothetical protein